MRCRSCQAESELSVPRSRYDLYRCAKIWRRLKAGLSDLDPRGDRSDARRLHRGRRCHGVTTAGIFGDILVMRMAKRGVTALVTDGVIRDKVGCLRANMPILPRHGGTGLVNGLTFVGWNEPMPAAEWRCFPRT